MLQVIWQLDCISQLQLAATNTAYLVGAGGHRKLITICGKFSTVSHKIWQIGSQNLEKTGKSVVPTYTYTLDAIKFH